MTDNYDIDIEGSYSPVTSIVIILRLMEILKNRRTLPVINRSNMEEQKDSVLSTIKKTVP